MVVLEDHKIRLVERESELIDLLPGYETKVKLSEGEPQWLVCEGIINGKHSFIEQKINDGENPHKILSHRSALRYLQFDDQNGIIFNHLHYDISVYESGENYWKARKMLEDAGKWEEFKQVISWGPKR
ncbi:MAG: hypothetical protein AABW91_01250 [Nanoarchaeota archaeon]